jgi:hypothetical protein
LTTEQLAILDEELNVLENIKLESHSVLTLAQLIQVQAAASRVNFRLRMVEENEYLHKRRELLKKE